MTPSHILEQVVLHTGLPGHAEAQACVGAVLRALAPSLPPRARELIAARTGLALDRETADRGARFGVEEFIWRVATARHVTRARAVEEAHAVCGAVAAALEPADRHELQRVLPRDLAPWFPEILQVDHPAPVRSRSGHTLATGRPGSLHPLSESVPRAGQSESVARASEPHRDDKLSSGRPHPSDPLADSPPGSRSPLTGRPRDR